MANTSESARPFEKLKRLADPSGSMGASSDSEYVTPLASESEHATRCSAPFFSTQAERISSERKEERGAGTSVEDEIERSKVHWSQPTEHSDSDDDQVAEVSNVEVFKSLQMHPTCGQFFCTFGDGGIHDAGELGVGEKFAAGGQGELFHAHITWNNPEFNLWDQKYGVTWVLKVFRTGTFLRDLQKQWPRGLFRDYEERVELQKRGKSRPIKYCCDIHCGTLLRDGRFAILIMRETGDLRALIDYRMTARTCHDRGPFPKTTAVVMMYRVAQGMDWLHNLNIVHRDLKASNVFFSLFRDDSGTDTCDYYVADFECSIGVVGTGFFRAPEILQALNDKVVNERPNVLTKAGDVYSYGMTCYEILTGKLPFEGHAPNDYDLVLKGHRPEVPDYVDEWACDLLSRCWQFDPEARPTFGEILNFLEADSMVCKNLAEDYMRLKVFKNMSHLPEVWCTYYLASM